MDEWKEAFEFALHWSPRIAVILVAGATVAGVIWLVRYALTVPMP